MFLRWLILYPGLHDHGIKQSTVHSPWILSILWLKRIHLRNPNNLFVFHYLFLPFLLWSMHYQVQLCCQPESESLQYPKGIQVDWLGGQSSVGCFYITSHRVPQGGMGTSQRVKLLPSTGNLHPKPDSQGGNIPFIVGEKVSEVLTRLPEQRSPAYPAASFLSNLTWGNNSPGYGTWWVCFSLPLPWTYFLAGAHCSTRCSPPCSTAAGSWGLMLLLWLYIYALDWSRERWRREGM